MDVIHAEELLMMALLAVFMFKRWWGLAFAALGFIFMTVCLSIFLQHSGYADMAAVDLANAILRIAGCVWLTVAGTVRYFGKGEG